ncbi:hypothetical protein Nepgr_020294 [Nepenthes gracilis]|uniref:Uncharacterized protein n=1 Tax=Nepenthes gracilis TaxID=150966 RepID=A0AAD3SUT7_NEPGR|nr:hypothetical protein Nepgr_020294 [Nepenthes gracilis]
MDFHALKRRDLQALCKKNRIPANMTNVAMADALRSLEIVEGLDEFLKQSEYETLESPEKPSITSAIVPRTSTRKKTSKREQESLKSTTRYRPGASRSVTVEETDGEKKNMHETLASPSTRRRAMEGKKLETLTKEKSGATRVYSTRRSARLLESKARELCFEVSDNASGVKINDGGNDLERKFEETLEEKPEDFDGFAESKGASGLGSESKATNTEISAESVISGVASCPKLYCLIENEEGFHNDVLQKNINRQKGSDSECHMNDCNSKLEVALNVFDEKKVEETEKANENECMSDVLPAILGMVDEAFDESFVGLPHDILDANSKDEEHHKNCTDGVPSALPPFDIENLNRHWDSGNKLNSIITEVKGIEDAAIAVIPNDMAEDEKRSVAPLSPEESIKSSDSEKPVVNGASADQDKHPEIDQSDVGVAELETAPELNWISEVQHSSDVDGKMRFGPAITEEMSAEASDKAVIVSNIIGEVTNTEVDGASVDGNPGGGSTVSMAELVCGNNSLICCESQESCVADSKIEFGSCVFEVLDSEYSSSTVVIPCAVAEDIVAVVPPSAENSAAKSGGDYQKRKADAFILDKDEGTIPVSESAFVHDKDGQVTGVDDQKVSADVQEESCNAKELMLGPSILDNMAALTNAVNEEAGSVAPQFDGRQINANGEAKQKTSSEVQQDTDEGGEPEYGLGIIEDMTDYAATEEADSAASPYARKPEADRSSVDEEQEKELSVDTSKIESFASNDLNVSVEAWESFNEALQASELPEAEQDLDQLVANIYDGSATNLYPLHILVDNEVISGDLVTGQVTVEYADLDSEKNDHVLPQTHADNSPVTVICDSDSCAAADVSEAALNELDSIPSQQMTTNEAAWKLAHECDSHPLTPKSSKIKSAVSTRRIMNTFDSNKENVAVASGGGTKDQEPRGNEMPTTETGTPLNAKSIRWLKKAVKKVEEKKRQALHSVSDNCVTIGGGVTKLN